MPLHAPPAPAAALRSVLAALGSRTAALRDGRARSDTYGELRPELPLPVHVLSGITGPGEPPTTALTGWRFLLRGTEASVGTAEAMLTPDGWAFSHFAEGPYVRSTETALRRAEALPTPYQPRLLSVPELYMLTLWLHADPGADPADGALAPADLLVPLAPAPPGIAPNLPHRVDALLPLLTHRLVPAPLLQTPA
ncbi:hypothetical protein V1J52_24820 [Streptomyces sp. TRM 70351]|uniref:hypothetical protein n=1 Tax=Streptomyces sp. TRM 70351 TaxID=3116552 RepID=UPI002E7ACFC0|nr:hypothetical protein [Streptomyces sp. TRM 70351]MEE1931345.1 hypothetical protein [Streptomyces sp. TRM 70351]